MPTVPRYQSQGQMPSETGNVPISPDMAALPAKAMANMGEGIANVGNSLFKYQEEEARWERAIKAAEIENNLKGDVDNFATSLQGKTSQEIDAARDEFWKSTQDKYTQAYGQDVNLKKTLQVSLWKNKFDIEHVARGAKARALTDEAEAQHTIFADSSLKEYLAASPEERPLVEADYANKTRELIQDRSKAEKAIQQFGQKADKALFAGMLENDPQAAERAANDPSMFTRVDAVERATYPKQARLAAESKLREDRVVKDHEEKERREAARKDFHADILKKTEKRNGLMVPSDFRGPAWEKLKETDPEYANKRLDEVRKDMQSQASQSRSDRALSLQIKRMEQDQFATDIMGSADFQTRDLKRDVVMGKLRLEDLSKLERVQNDMDPIKRASVKDALSKVGTGAALAKALSGVPANEEAAWKVKYANLIRTFALNHAQDPDFDVKMGQFVENNILRKMTESLWSLDATDRQKKWQQDKEAAGEQDRGTSPPPVRSTSSFDDANLKSQQQWFINNEPKITAKLKGKPAGTYQFPGSSIPVVWDGKGGVTMSIPRAKR